MIKVKFSKSPTKVIRGIGNYRITPDTPPDYVRYKLSIYFDRRKYAERQRFSK